MHHLRLRPQRPEPRAPARARGHRRSSRWTPIRSACARPRPTAASSCTATRAGARRWSAAGLAKARAVAITFADTPVALKILHHVHSVRPELPVIVRTLDDSEIDRLLEAGADRGRSRGARRQPDARVAFAAAARRSAQSRAGAHPRDPRGALQPVPRLLPRRDRRRGRGREPAAAAAYRCMLPDRAVGGRPHARRARARRPRRGHRRAPPRRALATARARTGVSRPATSSCCSAGRRSSRSPSSGCSKADRGLPSRARPTRVTDRGSLRAASATGYNQRPFRMLGLPVSDSPAPRLPPRPPRCPRTPSSWPT